jgi:hypothetical protein
MSPAKFMSPARRHDRNPTRLISCDNINTTLTFFTTLSLFFFIKWDLEGTLAFYCGRFDNGRNF